MAGTGPRIVEARTARAGSEDLRARMRAAALSAAADAASREGPVTRQPQSEAARGQTGGR